jgi:hypothetical protein
MAIAAAVTAAASPTDRASSASASALKISSRAISGSPRTTIAR